MDPRTLAAAEKSRIHSKNFIWDEEKRKIVDGLKISHNCYEIQQQSQLKIEIEQSKRNLKGSTIKEKKKTQK